MPRPRMRPAWPPRAESESQAIRAAAWGSTSMLPKIDLVNLPGLCIELCGAVRPADDGDVLRRGSDRRDLLPLGRPQAESTARGREERDGGGPTVFPCASDFDAAAGAQAPEMPVAPRVR